MKHILSLALIVAVIGFINAQLAPTPLAVCQVYTNTTATAFCSATTYQVPATVDIVAANTNANGVYTGIIGQIATPSQQCQDAVRAFSCQSVIPRCGRYTPVTGIAQSRCDAVNTACNITDGGFPNNYTTIRCVRNTIASIDGQNVVCVPTVFTTVNAACAVNIFDPTIVTPTTIQTVACPFVSSCNTTAGANTCVRPATLGQSCAANSDCAPIAGSPSTNLECLGGRCSYRGKRHAQTCTVNEECRSNNCVNGACFESAFGGNCTSSLNCRDNLWCDIRNGTCYNVAQSGEQCGIVQTNWSPVPCVNGFTCVREFNTTTGFSYCRANAELGEKCSVPATAVAYDAPFCDPTVIPTSGPAVCRDGLCQVGTVGQLEGQGCNSTTVCIPTLTCKYAATNATQGVCAQPNTVACDTVGGNQCALGFQKCSCTGDVTATGTCAVQDMNPLVACAAQVVGLAQCLKTSCKSTAAAFIPYDGDSCGATQCLNQINAYFCCAKGVVGANYVPPAGQPTDPCVVPTTPAPTGPTTSGPGSNTPTPTPSRSGAAAVAVSFVAMIVAVIAFCL